MEANRNVAHAMEKGKYQASAFICRWDFLQLQCAQYINSETPGMTKKQESGRAHRYVQCSVLYCTVLYCTALYCFPLSRGCYFLGVGPVLEMAP